MIDNTKCSTVNYLKECRQFKALVDKVITHLQSADECGLVSSSAYGYIQRQQKDKYLPGV
ncbi:hypothetical protein EXN66_Car004140 [Channa argus]|uniref:Uncharacterized protein n=1 Tax=Channa argus TaxID=215402 RepID=A0A6G1PEM6_CHAAH|nr:hypothetical protein EXN66_Car004140 [Channa argus]